MEKKLDYKKEYKDIYLPKQEPMLINIESINYVMVQGKGNPNQKDGQYKKALEILYAISYTIKMSKMGKEKLQGYFDYVVPPLEGLWWQEAGENIDFTQKEEFEWIAMIRQPEFVTKEVFEWAIKKVKESKPHLEVEKAYFQNFEEGLCVQIMHQGSYDDEPETIKKLEEYIQLNNLKNAIGTKLENKMIRRHHEIYLSDPRKCAKGNLKTVLRIPVKK